MCDVTYFIFLVARVFTVDSVPRNKWAREINTGVPGSSCHDFLGWKTVLVEKNDNKVK